MTADTQAPAPGSTVVPEALTFTYTNWRGETAERRVKPASIRVGWGSTEWHPEPQWLVNAFDLDKGRFRNFAWKDIAFARPAPTADMVLVPRSVLAPFASVVDAKSFRHLQPEQRLYVETHAEHVVCEGLRARDFIAVRDALAASQTPSPVPADAHVALGHLYEIATSVGGDIAGDIRHHANAIMWAMTSPSPASVPPLAGEAGADEWAQREAYRKGFADGGRIERERADWLEEENGFLLTRGEGAAVEADAMEALRPFARMIDALDMICAGKPGEDEPKDDKTVMVTWGLKGSGKDAALTYGDLRRARDAYAALPFSPPKAETETASGETVAVPYDDFHAAYRHVPRSRMSPDDCLKTRLRAFLRAEDVAHADEAEAYTTAPAETASERERLVEALCSCVEVIDDYLAYQHDGDPWSEDARLMGEMGINHFARDGRLERARAALSTETGR